MFVTSERTLLIGTVRAPSSGLRLRWKQLYMNRPGTSPSSRRCCYCDMSINMGSVVSAGSY